MLHCCEPLRHATAALGSSDILLLLLLCALEKTQSNTNTHIHRATQILSNTNTNIEVLLLSNTNTNIEYLCCSVFSSSSTATNTEQRKYSYRGTAT